MKKLLLGIVLLALSSLASAAGPQATLTWSYVDADIATYSVTGFAVEKKAQACAGTGTFSALTTLAATARGYVDTAIAFGNTYCYRVAAVNATGKGYSNNAEKVNTLPVPPSPTLTIEIIITLGPDGLIKVTQVQTK